MKLFIRDIETGVWESVDVSLYHTYKKHPLITIVRGYRTVTAQQAYDDALKDLNELIEMATQERANLLSKNALTITNQATGNTEKIEKAQDGDSN